MYSAHNDEISVVAERVFRTLKNKSYNYITSISKNVHIDKLVDTAKEYNNTYHSTIKMNRASVKSSTFSDYNAEKNDKDR